MNQVAMVGKMKDIWQAGDRYYMEIEVDDETFTVRVWLGIYDVLKGKEQDTLLGLKGKITNDDKITNIQCERISVLSIGE